MYAHSGLSGVQHGEGVVSARGSTPREASLRFPICEMGIPPPRLGPGRLRLQDGAPRGHAHSIDPGCHPVALYYRAEGLCRALPSGRVVHVSSPHLPPRCRSGIPGYPH